MIRNTLLNTATLAAGGLATALLLAPLDATAVPSFARQTGAQCASCHTVFEVGCQ